MHYLQVNLKAYRHLFQDFGTFNPNILFIFLNNMGVLKSKKHVFVSRKKTFFFKIFYFFSKNFHIFFQFFFFSIFFWKRKLRDARESNVNERSVILFFSCRRQQRLPREPEGDMAERSEAKRILFFPTNKNMFFGLQDTHTIQKYK